MEKLTFRQSWHEMTALLKKCKKQVFVLLLLILLPALVIRVYSFQTLYGDFSLRYDLINEQSLTEAVLKGDVTAAAEQFDRIFPDETDEQSLNDTVLEIVFFLLSLGLDVGVLYFGLNAFGEQKPAEEEKRRWLWRSALQITFISLLIQWVLSYGQSFVVPVLLQAVAVSHVSALFAGTAWIAFLISASTSWLFVTWLTLFFQIMAILCLSGRTRVFFSFGYAREILRGRMWQTILHVLPLVLFSFLVPALLQGAAMLSMANNTAIGLSLAGASLVVEAVSGVVTWLFLIPNVFFMEKQSGIREKIQAAIKERENGRDE